MADNGSFACFSERASEQGCNREAAAVFPSPPSIIFYGKMGNIIKFECVIYTYFEGLQWKNSHEKIIPQKSLNQICDLLRILPLRIFTPHGFLNPSN